MVTPEGREHRDCARKYCEHNLSPRLLRPQEDPRRHYHPGGMAERVPRWLSDAEQQSWRTLIDVTTGVLATLDAELRAEHGLSLGEYEVLARLSEEPEHSLRMTDLAGAPAALAQRDHPADRRARPVGSGRAQAVPVRPAGVERGAHRRRPAPAARGGADPRARACARTSSTSCRRDLAHLASGSRTSTSMRRAPRRLRRPARRRSGGRTAR